ncbi:MAG: TetR/AcrR family transcriptional regulator [Lachnotalea sp.]
MENKNNTLQNNITKESIFTSLMILMEQKNFKEITITEMTKKAGVSRMAFYRNYTVMEDIIICYLDELLQEYSMQILDFESIDNYMTP